ncbi:CBS domain-containing protein [Citreimonas salinaria]|uniref:BON domain-containing protein n=1 Tax=Citreimonas salinaria TaxID=321339 RepID=A0A1H3KAQ9_9RHOB|nr:CBS domain-containing protein [Citreimonas salinaria]SDY48644.1 BON domain-containing protein [Citreimonas salinaria]
MQAKHVMTQDVITVRPTATVEEIAERLLMHRISGVPVLNDAGEVVGIVSEGDLVRRIEDADSHGSWWLRLFGSSVTPAEYVKRHGRRAQDVMTRDVSSVAPETPLGEIARLLERKRIKRVPVVDETGRLVGIISRANLLQGIAAAKPLPAMQPSDEELREKVAKALQAIPALVSSGVNATVTDGDVELWGFVASDDEERAARIAVENVEGVRTVESHLRRMPPNYVGAY